MDSESPNEINFFQRFVGSPSEQLNGPVILREYDNQWPNIFTSEAKRIKSAIGEKALLIEHVGSTSIPGLAAKPIIDILLVVANSAKENSYLPDLEAAGYFLRVREPEWHEHRLFKGPDADINLHVFSHGDDEIERMLIFRDWLRTNEEDRDLYLKTKRELALKRWRYLQDYANAKSEIIESLIKLARFSASIKSKSNSS